MVEPDPLGESDASAVDEPILFISDASAEAERLTVALRARGYVVIDVPVALLVNRVAVQRPAAILCDADTEDTVPTLDRIRDVAGDPPIPVVLLGQRSGTMEAIDPDLVAAAFARPVNVQELTVTVQRLVGSPRRDGKTTAPPGRPKLVMSSRPPRTMTSAVPRPSDRANRIEPGTPSIQPLLPPDLAGDAPQQKEAPDSPAVELSAEVQRALIDAERRLGETKPAPASDRDDFDPDADAEGPLPPDVLSALDEPLDEEEEEIEEPAPDPSVVTGRTTASPIANRNETQGGRTGSRVGGGAGGTEAALPSSPGEAAPVLTSSTAMTGHSIVSFGTSVHPGALPAPGPDDDARKARQQATTPKPPPRAPEDAGPASTDPPRRGSVMPETRGPGDLLPLEAPLDIPLDVPIDVGSEPITSSEVAPVAAAPGTVKQPAMTAPTVPPNRRDTRTPEVARDEPISEIPRRAPAPPLPSKSAEERPAFLVPDLRRRGDALLALARAIRHRFTGTLAFEVDQGIRRAVFREGDFVTVVSGVHGESLVTFLASRGDLPPDVARQAHKLPAFGRRAGAALIAQGHLAQDDLWPVLRAHAEWLVGRIIGIERGVVSIEEQLIGRLQDEPAVFGGATGAEVLVEIVRRVVPPEEALERLGGASIVLTDGPARALLGECALPQAEAARVERSATTTVAEFREGAADPSFVAALYALVSLEVLAPEGARRKAKPEPRAPERDAIDDEALRARILSRKALIDEGDYFSVLGVSRDATGYDIRRAYTSLRRDFEPSRVLTAATADLRETVDEILEVLEEAYEILSDQRRRDRYRRAIEAAPGVE